MNSVLDITSTKVRSASSRFEVPVHDPQNLAADFGARRYQRKADV